MATLRGILTNPVYAGRIYAGRVRYRPPKVRRSVTHPVGHPHDSAHTDAFGTDSFGEWDTGTQSYWIIRLAALTDPTVPQGAIGVNEETLEQSLAIVDGEGRVIGGAFHETMPPFDMEPPFREDDPFLDTVMGIWEPLYAAFREVYDEGKVSHHLMIACSDDLPKEDAFELVAASAERYRALGYEYLVTEATNQWTGAAFEALGGVRVQFSPFQARRPSRRARTDSSLTRTAGACSTSFALHRGSVNQPLHHARSTVG